MKKYSDIVPIDQVIPAERQGAKRHYGVHPYFTRRPFNVVRDYILHYSRPGDRVLDPFGGSGVTAIEAFLENRVGIQNDINPLANFIANGIAGLSKGNISDYRQALSSLENHCSQRLQEIEAAGMDEVESMLKRIQLPDNVVLPLNSDVVHLHDLFFPKQLLALGLIKNQIEKLSNKYARNAMMLALSATITKLNRTFLSAAGRAASRGGSSIFSIYRYKVAKAPIELSLWPTFQERALNVIDAKLEIDKAISLKTQTDGWQGKFKHYSYDVLDLPKKLDEPVDYIFTDPPYGGHIAYIDLSKMWNAWLGILPTSLASKKEIIVGGDLRHNEETYIKGLGDSVRASVQLLKKDRWISIVFQHWKSAYFEAILAAAADSGADLKAAVSQVGDPIWSMHKKKGSDSVLAGELILTFYKTGKKIHYETGGYFDWASEVSNLLREMPEPLYGELLFNKLVVAAWHRGAITSLNISKTDFSNLLESLGWKYDAAKHYWLKGHEEAHLL